MPLVKGKKASSPKGFSENVRHEYLEEKKPLKQSVAIAYSEADRGKKKKSLKTKVLSHIKDDSKEFRKQLKDDVKLKKMVKKGLK